MIKTFTYSGITGPDNFRFNIARSTLDVAAFEWHTHEFSELVIILGGTAIHITDMGRYPLVAGDIFVLNGAMAHGFEDCAGLRLCNIMYDPAQLLPILHDVHHLPGYHALFVVEPRYREHHPSHNLLRLPMASLGRVDGLISDLISENTHKTPGYASMIQGRFMQLVVLLSRLHSAYAEARSEPIGRLSEALALIETAYDRALTLDDLANAAHMSQTHFLRLFKEMFDVSPIQYLIRQRIARACHLLHDPTLRVADVAQAVGFTDFNYFSRQFKQVMGHSPRDYRKAHTP
jgi:AraC-like DNA-binding protein